MEELSVQELIDCSWAYDNHGCRGGWSWRALKFVGEHGLATRKSYGKYLGQVRVFCVRISSFKDTFKITSTGYMQTNVLQ